jgi:hypothetical protein
MGIDYSKRRRLCPQMHKNANQRCMLDHIREIAGMERMTVVHGRCRAKRSRLLRLDQH